VDFEEALLPGAKRARALPGGVEALALLQPTLEDKVRRWTENTNPIIEPTRKVRPRVPAGRARRVRGCGVAVAATPPCTACKSSVH
jgi:hypothetical protein